MRNQIVGPVPMKASPAKAAMPIIEPTMSMAYARNGGIERSSGPRGSASDASIAVTRTTIRGRTR